MAPVRLRDMMALVRDPRWSNDGSGYGQVAHLRADVPSDLGVLWMSITGAVASPFVPVYLGVIDIPPEYKQHRYMTKASDWAFLDPEYAPLEGTRSAFRVHKRLLYHTCEHPERFLAPVTGDLEDFESRLLAEQSGLEEEARALMAAGDVDSARARLTAYTKDRLLDGLELGEALVARVEAGTRDEFGIRMPDVEVPFGASWRPESQEMTQRPGQTYHRCFMDGFADYPRVHGSYDSLAAQRLVSRVLRPGGGARERGSATFTLLVPVALLLVFIGFTVGRAGGRPR